MTAADATVLAAIIAGAVVALTFLTTEILKVRAARAERRTAALTRLVAAVDVFTEYSMERATRFSPSNWFRAGHAATGVYTQMLSAATALYAAIPRRDHRVADWICWRLLAPGRPASIEEIGASGEVRAVVVVYIKSRRRARRFVHLPHPEFEDWLRATESSADPSVARA